MSLTSLQHQLQDLDLITDPSQVLKLSQDYCHFSPVLYPQLGQKRGDLVVKVRREAEVVRVAQACVQQGVPLTVRGSGTGNYGQCVPLQGGVVLDLSLMTGVDWLRSGLVRVEPGVKLGALEKHVRPQGWELRMLPSTYRTATIAGFIAGGSGGIGSINYGFLGDRGNVTALRVVSLEDPPQILELRGEDVQAVSHAYGTNGIITAVELPLAPAQDWIEWVVSFPSFSQGTQFCQALAESDGLVKRLISFCDWPIPLYFTTLAPQLPPQQPIALLLLAPASLEACRDLVQHHQGQVCLERSSLAPGHGLSLTEYTWNHTTLHARRADPSLTYLQTLFPLDPDLTLVHQLRQQFGDEVIFHGEWIRSQGQARLTGLQLVRYQSHDRLQTIMDDHEAQGAIIFNPHTHYLEGGGRKTVDPRQLAFKQRLDPHGLLNPGKMHSWPPA